MSKTLTAFKLLVVRVSCKCGHVMEYSEGVRAELFEPPARKLLTQENLEALLRLCPEAPRRKHVVERQVDACPKCFELRDEGFPYPVGLTIGKPEEAKEKTQEKLKKQQKLAQKLLDELF